MKSHTNIVAVIVVVIFIFYIQSDCFIIVNLQRGDEIRVIAMPKISAGKLFKNVFGVLQWT